MGAEFARGEIQLVKVGEDLWVANMIAQEGIYSKKGIPPIRYDSVRSCLNKLAADAMAEGASIHVPRLGCGLAGGRWKVIESIINDTLISNGIPVFVYDLK